MELNLATSSSLPAGSQLAQLALNQLVPASDQPRQEFVEESLEELAQSIRSYGILQPLIVTPHDNEHSYLIIAGERRWRAAARAGLKTVPCVIRKLEQHTLLEMALLENIQREDLSVLDEARSYARLMEEHGYTQASLAQKLGKPRSVIANLVRILSLPPAILDDLQLQIISLGHAKLLCTLPDERSQKKIHKAIISRKLSVRQTEEFIKSLSKQKSNRAPLKDHISPDLRYICDQFKGHLGTRVKIMGDSKKGKIEINYYTQDDFDRIAELILGNV